MTEFVINNGAAVFLLTTARSRNEKWWNTTKTLTLVDLGNEFATMSDGVPHKKRRNKDGECYVPALLLGGQRNIRSVSYVSMLVYDVDGSQSLDDVRKRINDSNLIAFVHTTHSHRATQTEVAVDDYEKWAKKAKEGGAPTLARWQLYFKDKGKPWMADRNIAFDDMGDGSIRRVAGKGTVYVVEHAPLDKIRVIIPLATPIDMLKLATNNKTANDKYRAIYRGVGKMLGLDYDLACQDPTRLYYFPSCPETTHAHAFAADYDGALLDWTKVTPDAIPVSTNTMQEHDRHRAGAERELMGWLKNYGKTFRIVDALGGDVEEKFIVTCPFEDEHTEAGGTGTIVSNPTDEYGFSVYCAHTSCLTERGSQRGNGVDRLPYIIEWLRSGVLTIDDLENTELGGGKVTSSAATSVDNSKKPTRDEIRETIKGLSTESTSDNWSPIVESLALLHDESFNAEAFDLICAATGKRMKVTLEKAYKQGRRTVALATREHDIAAQADNNITPEGRRLFRDWDVQYREGSDAVCRDVWKAIVALNVPKRLFRTRAGVVVRLLTDPKTGQAIAQEMTKAEMRHEITKATVWEETDDIGIPHAKPTPDFVAEHMWTATDAPLDYLAGFADAPFFTKDGVLVQTEGYHADSQFYYQAPKGFALPRDVPENPDDELLATSLAVLRKRALANFPFYDGKDKPTGVVSASFANFVAKLITPFCRQMIDGPTPIFATMKTLTGIGGSLLTDVFAMIAYGHAARSDTAPKTAEEWRKSIQTKIKEGRRHYLYGNIHEKVKDDTLAEATTADYLDFRVLGSHDSGGGNVFGIWDFVGNNVRFSQEIARRVVPINIEAAVESASERGTFEIPYLKKWLSEYRPEIVFAVLVIIRAGMARRPSDWSTKPKTKILQSYEEWSAVVGGILFAVGVENFLGNLDRASDNVEEGTDDIKGLVALWWETFADKMVMVGSLEFDATVHDLPKGGPVDLCGLCLLHKNGLELAFKSRKPDGWAWALGQLLGDAKGRTFYLDGVNVRLTYERTSKVRGWRLEVVVSDGVTVK